MCTHKIHDTFDVPCGVVLLFIYSHYTRYYDAVYSDYDGDDDEVMCSIIGKTLVNWRCHLIWGIINPPYGRDM